MGREYLKEQLRERLREYVESVTERSRAGGVNMYCCPLCGSGTRQGGDGAFSIKDGVTWRCFSCGEGGDLFELIGKIENTDDFNQKFKIAREFFGISEDGEGATISAQALTESARKKAELAKQRQASTAETPQAAEPAKVGGSPDFFLQAHKNIDETDYWRKRGFSEGTMNRFGVGYVEEWRHPKAQGAPTSPRLIIPTGGSSYLARDTRPELTEVQQKYSKAKVGEIQIFNKEALQTADKPIFIVEGEIDALSIIEAGGEAVGLGSTSMMSKFLSLVEEQKPTQPLILALDNDERGQKASRELVKGLGMLGVPFISFNPYGDYKDANEALQRDRAAFIRAVSKGESFESLQEAPGQEAKGEYKRKPAGYYLQDFLGEIAESINTPCICTGFDLLDDVLDGGLYEGLYFIGAISSLGKTTLALQIADQVAKTGADVLIFSLEMARSELMSKSISRLTCQIANKTGGNMSNAKTARGITAGHRYKAYSREEIQLINSAVKAYGEYADNIYIIEGLGDIGYEQVREAIEEHIFFTGKSPLVIIDYLQILAPHDVRASDKQATDKNVLELKRISRDFKIPIIGVSSFNRENYKNAVTMAAFKESGAIEYGSDVLMGLQLEGAGTKDFDVEAAKKANPRRVELVILKNRNGRTGDMVRYEYYPPFNLFKEF